MELELNKYFIANITKIVLSYCGRYRIATEQIKEDPDETSILNIINLDTGEYDAIIDTKSYVNGLFGLYNNLVYYIFSDSTEDDIWSLQCYDIKTELTTQIFDSSIFEQDLFPLKELLIVKDVLYINRYIGPISYNLITGVIAYTKIPIIEDMMLSIDQYGTQEWIDQNGTKIRQTSNKLIIDNTYLVNGIFKNELDKWLIVKVYDDLVYAIDNFSIEDKSMEIYIYNYKTNTLINKIEWLMPFNYYTFIDQSKTIHVT